MSRELCASCLVFLLLSHRRPFQGLQEVPLPLLLVLPLPEEPVLPQHLLLGADLEELHRQPPLLLRLPRQPPHQLLVALGVLAAGRREGSMDRLVGRCMTT